MAKEKIKYESYLVHMMSGKPDVEPGMIREIEVSYSRPKGQPYTVLSSLSAVKAVMPLYKRAGDIEYRERVYAILLNRQNVVIGILLLSAGGTSATYTDAKMLFATALKANASSLILVHNHPSGDPKPSQEDVKTAINIKNAASLLEIKLLDSIIIGNPNVIDYPSGYYSFNDEEAL